MKKYLIKLMCILCLFSCNEIKNIKMTAIERISLKDPHLLSDLIDTLRYVCLGNDDELFSGRIDKIMSKGDTLYVFDYMVSKSLIAYTKDGNFLFKVGRLGRGPGEYIEMASFTIDDNYFYCVDNAKQKLLIYDINNGTYIREHKMPNYADDIAMFKDGKFIFYLDDEPSLGGVYITDNNLNIIDKLFTVTKDDYCSMSTITAFTENKDKIIFSRYAKDTIIVFDKHSYHNQNCYLMDFGSSKASVHDKIDSEKLAGKQYLIPPVYISGDMIIGDINLPSEGKNDFWRYGGFIYTTKAKKIFQNSKIINILDKKVPLDKNFVLPFKAVVDDEIICMLDSYTPYDELVELGFPLAPPHIKKRIDNKETVLVFYKLK